MSTETVFANARIVTRDAVLDGTVRVADGRIVAVEEGATAVRGIVDLEGDYLIPGLVELHTDHLERHFMPRPGVAWPPNVAVLAHDAQLAAAGITTVLDAISIGDLHERTGRARPSDGMVEAVRWGKDAGHFRVDHYIHLRCEIVAERVVERVEAFLAEPLVLLASLMDHTPGQRQFVSLDKYREYYQGKYGYTDAEIEGFIAEQRERQERFGGPHRRRLVSACRVRGVALASHDDATPEHVGEAVAEGVVIAEFPTTVAAARAAHGAGLAVLMGGPNVVLGGSHSGNVSARELAGAGLLDVLSSDYVPSSMLHGAFLLAGPEVGLPLPEAIAKVTSRPAELIGLDDRGAVETGRLADLVRVRATPDGPVVRAVWRGGERAA